MDIISFEILCHFYGYIVVTTWSNMASPGQKCGGCGHLMVGFDSHSFCVRSVETKVRTQTLVFLIVTAIPVTFLLWTNVYSCPNLAIN